VFGDDGGDSGGSVVNQTQQLAAGLFNAFVT
jgi:hypothetical protein